MIQITNNKHCHAAVMMMMRMVSKSLRDCYVRQRILSATIVLQPQPPQQQQRRTTTTTTTTTSSIGVKVSTGTVASQRHSTTTATTSITSTTTTATNESFLLYNNSTTNHQKPILLNQSRSDDTIQQLVRQRVYERNKYMDRNSIYSNEQQQRLRSDNTNNSTTASITSHITNTLSIWKDMVQQMIHFRIPSQKQLDIDFPIQHPMDWNAICGYHTNNSHINNNNNNHESNTIHSSPPNTTTTTTTTTTPPKMQVTWFGHSSLLIQYPNGINVLTDPIFSNHCSPFPSWLGPKRYRPLPCPLTELLHHIPIHVVLLSHNHYDHCDLPTIRQLFHQAPTRTRFVVPLGVQDWLRRQIHADIVTYELDWYEYMEYDPTTSTSTTTTTDGNSASSATTPTLQIRSVPMKHWSSRYGYDRDQTLWCGYSLEYNVSSNSKYNIAPTSSSTIDDNHNNNNNNIIKNGGDGDSSTTSSSSSSKFLFSGDTAYYDGMQRCLLPNHAVVAQQQQQQQQQQSSSTSNNNKNSENKYYYYDIAAIPIGAYEPRPLMYHNHMNVAEAIQMKDDIACQHAIPIHYGTFPLTVEPVLEPIDQLRQLMQHRPDSHTFVPWRIGETKQY